MRRFSATFCIACTYCHDSASSFQGTHPPKRVPALQIETKKHRLPSGGAATATTGLDISERGYHGDPMSMPPNDNNDPKGRLSLLSFPLRRLRPRNGQNSKAKDRTRKRRDRTRIEAVSIASIGDESPNFYYGNGITRFLRSNLPFPSFGARSSDVSAALDLDLDLDSALELNQQSTSNLQNRLDVTLTNLVESTLTTKLKQWAIHTSKLSVTADLVSSQWFRHFVRTRGTQLSSSLIHIAFDRVAFPNLKLSGGGTLDVLDMTLDLPSTLLAGRGRASDAPHTSGQDSHLDNSKTPKRKARRRFPSSFEFHAQDIVLTQDDIRESSCIQNGLESLFNRILKRNKMSLLNSSQIIVKQVDVLPCGRLTCRCDATMPSGHAMPMEIRTGLAVTSQGHVLSMPNMELSINPGLGLFVPVLPEIHLDLGHNARIMDIEIVGKRRQIRLDARVTITPDIDDTAKHIPRKFQQDRNSYLAHYTCDVGKFVTNLGKFHV